MSEGLDKDTIKSELPPTYLWQNVVISQKSNQPEVIQCILYKLKSSRLFKSLQIERSLLSLYCKKNKINTPLMYEVLDKDTIKSEFLPYLSVAKRGYVTKSNLVEVI